MRKNNVNDKVLRAMAIGIAAMLTATTPMTVLASGETSDSGSSDTTGDGGGGSDDNSGGGSGDGDGGSGDGGSNDGGNGGDGGNDNSGETNSNSASEAADEASDAASESTKAAASSAATVKEHAGDSVSEDEVGKVLSDAVKNAAANVENTGSEGGAPIADAETDITNADTQLDIANTNDRLSDTACNKADSAAKEASAAASEAKDAMDAANATVDEQSEKLQNAGSIDEANAAYGALEETANNAQTVFNTKLEEYNAAKTAYDEAAAKVAEYEKAYNDAIASAGANAKAAEDELAAAKKNAVALQKAVEEAKNAVETSAKAALDIAAMEDLTRNDGTLDWRKEDKLFTSIMQNYYLPEKLGIQGATVTRVQGIDNNEYNYFEVAYTENGEPKTKYFNYKMDGTSKDDIVIFEKREEEVDWEKYEKTNPDQYVKDSDKKTVVDVDAGLKDESIVNAKVEDKDEAKFVIKNGMTGSETLVSDSEITGTSKEDVTVDENTKQESWSYDAETGELVKTVTADVTTITYREATFTSDQSYATDAERNAEAEAKEKELEEATGKDATINKTEETTYTYTASGTYIPTFTKTVDVNKEYESGYLWYEADSKKEAKEKAYDWAKDEIDDDLGDYYLVGNIKSDLSVSMTEEETETYKIFGKKHTVVTDDSDYLVKGTVTATYAKVTKQTVNQSTFGALWDDIKSLFGSGESTNEKLEAAAKAAVEADGGIFVSANWDDWNFNKATIRYVAGVKVTTDEKDTKGEATAAVSDIALAQAKANGATGVINVNTTGTKDIAHTTYSYTVDYLKEDTNNTENKAVAKEIYGDAVGLSGQIIQNKNYYDGGDKILLTQKDEDYRTYVDDAKALTKKYDDLFKEAQKANEDVIEAQKKVQELKDAIDALKGQSNNAAKLDELNKQLEDAQNVMDEAQAKQDDIDEKLKKAGETLAQIIGRLTPDTDTTTGGGGGGGTTTTTVEAATTIINDVAVPLAAGLDGVTIDDTAVPLAAGLDGVTIDDEAVALADSIPQTGDNAVPVAPVAATGIAALMAAFFMGRRKKEDQ